MKTCSGQKIRVLNVLFLLGAVGLVSGLAADTSPTPSVAPSASASPSPGDTCNNASWNPEVYSFYGKKENVSEKVSNLPLKLSDHRVFLQITQGDAWARIKMYERQKDGSFTVTEWQAKDTARVFCDIEKSIMANKGVNCVSEQMKAVIVKAFNKGNSSHSVAPPETPAAAFSHSIKEAKGDFIKSTIIVAC